MLRYIFVDNPITNFDNTYRALNPEINFQPTPTVLVMNNNTQDSRFILLSLALTEAIVVY
ncbi:MAG: hypothetical protein KME64_09990 [Scytonematopsis contorta HA4267-MV1]|nr:hypothetical protein [Scytonematopsis contorta HA4267-MV1]